MAVWLMAVQTSASLPVAGGMTEMVNVSDARRHAGARSVCSPVVDDKKSPITYGYDDKLYVYFRQGPVIHRRRQFSVVPAGGPTKRRHFPRVPADAAPPATPT